MAPSAGGNAQLRRLSPHVGELWRGEAAALSTQPVQAGGGGSEAVGGVSSFGYSGTIANAVVQCVMGGAAGMGGVAAVRFRRRAFPWATATPVARDSSAVALYSTGWAELAAPAAPAPGGQWLAVQPTGAPGVAARALRAALPARVPLVNESLGGAVGGRQRAAAPAEPARGRAMEG